MGPMEMNFTAMMVPALPGFQIFILVLIVLHQTTLQYIMINFTFPLITVVMERSSTSMMEQAWIQFRTMLPVPPVVSAGEEWLCLIINFITRVIPLRLDMSCTLTTARILPWPPISKAGVTTTGGLTAVILRILLFLATNYFSLQRMQLSGMNYFIMMDLQPRE